MAASDLSDSDQLSASSVAHRIQSLDADGVRILLDHEREHAHRVAVMNVLGTGSRSCARVQSCPAVRRSREQPVQAPAPVGESLEAPDTEGPPVTPVSHADPTNPSQPRQ